MGVAFIQGLLSFATVFIALFIICYSYMFLIRTVHHKERRPWEFLFIASWLFMFFQVSALLAQFNIIEFVKIDLLTWSRVLEFLYSGAVLLAFVSQHDLILKNHLILISKKDEDQDGVKIREHVKKKISG